MAAVVPPAITYRPHLAPEIISKGLLSDIQLERVIYAGQRHEQRLPDGARSGFSVGDGTGVGKGRILAGIIADNWNQERRRVLWLSVNNDLLESTRRDLTDLGLRKIPLACINDFSAAGEITLPQRFFRQVICAFKVPSMIAETDAALNDDKSVVISLVGTGEARTREQVARTMVAGGQLEDLDFSPREVIAAMIERGFPTTLYQDMTDPVTGKTIQVPVKDEQGNIVQSKQALEMRQRLIDGLSSLELPENPLDQLVNYFGERQVAELTGRTRRLIRNSQTGQVKYKKRAPEGVAMQRTNVYEMEQFQGGKKHAAIISDAASTGISSHSSNRAANRQRRVPITLELGWSADK